MARRLVILGVAVVIAVTVSVITQASSENSDRTIIRVSLIQVIANPKEYDGQTLRIVGYLDHNGLDGALGVYVSEVDGRNFIVFNSIDLQIDNPEATGLIGRYVALQGVYHAPVPRSGSNGYIDRVFSIKAWKREGAATYN